MLLAMALVAASLAGLWLIARSDDPLTTSWVVQALLSLLDR
jgi:uncharacterized membrane protein